MATLKEKKDLAKSLGTGGANKAANALMSREAKMKAALEEAEGVQPKSEETPKEDMDEFSQAVSMVRKATKKPGGAMSRSNFS